MPARRTMFGTGVSKDFWFGRPVDPVMLPMRRRDVERDRDRLLKPATLPPGWTGTYPYIVKVAGEGEYIVYADGTAQYIDLRAGRVEPARLVETHSLWAKMFPLANGLSPWPDWFEPFGVR
jgi:hypothetical protein